MNSAMPQVYGPCRGRPTPGRGQRNRAVLRLPVDGAGVPDETGAGAEHVRDIADVAGVPELPEEARVADPHGELDVVRVKADRGAVRGHFHRLAGEAGGDEVVDE